MLEQQTKAVAGKVSIADRIRKEWQRIFLSAPDHKLGGPYKPQVIYRDEDIEVEAASVYDDGAWDDANITVRCITDPAICVTTTYSHLYAKERHDPTGYTEHKGNHTQGIVSASHGAPHLHVGERWHEVWCGEGGSMLAGGWVGGWDYVIGEVMTIIGDHEEEPNNWRTQLEQAEQRGALERYGLRYKDNIRRTTARKPAILILDSGEDVVVIGKERYIRDSYYDKARVVYTISVGPTLMLMIWDDGIVEYKNDHSSPRPIEMLAFKTKAHGAMSGILALLNSQAEIRK